MEVRSPRSVCLYHLTVGAPTRRWLRLTLSPLKLLYLLLHCAFMPAQCVNGRAPRMATIIAVEFTALSRQAIEELVNTGVTGGIFRQLLWERTDFWDIGVRRLNTYSFMDEARRCLRVGAWPWKRKVHPGFVGILPRQMLIHCVCGPENSCPQASARHDPDTSTRGVFRHRYPSHSALMLDSKGSAP